ncbi:MAG TPA: ComEC/Rec2 family competence protein [Ktedonobacteraceae bacterium]
MQIQKLRHSIHDSLHLRGLLLVILASSWLAGMVVNAWLLLAPLSLLSVGALALLIVCFCWPQPLLRLSGLVLLFLCLGAWRYISVVPANDAHAVHAFIGPAVVQIQGEISADPRLESHSTLLALDVQNISLDNGQSWQEIHGQIQVQVLGATFDDPYALRYGDKLRLTGKLTAPPGYATPELQASIAFPKTLLESRGGNPLLALFYQIRTCLASTLLQALPQPFAALLIAIFLSLRTPSLKPLLLFFNVTGTAHLIAPSGFKVTLFAGMIGAGTRWLIPRQQPHSQPLLPAERHRGDWRRWLHTLLLVLGIAIYTLLSGGGPAALRAGIMGTLLVLAPRLGRLYHVYTAMALTALLLSALNPFLLWDSGFQLSFIGTLGILLFTPHFQHLLRFLGHLPLGSHVAEIIAVTLAAEVATLPIFALSFHSISFIAPLANLVSVPLLGVLLCEGALICLSGLLASVLGMLAGWLAWPVLWFITTTITWCAQLPGAYLSVENTSPLAAWAYYALLGWLATLLFVRWPTTSHEQHPHSPILSRRVKLAVQLSLALLILLSTGILALAAPTERHLTITLLTTTDPTQGQALLLRTPDGQTALIDEGASGSALSQTLDRLLPGWQRSLSLLILSDTSTDNLAGLQDIITRYQVQRVVDAGMLHPSLAYARWRSTLETHNLSYSQARQGGFISIGDQTTFQVLWPPTPLHKSSNETHDNALVLRLLAPGLRLLLLNSAALSSYALRELANSVAPGYIQAEIVQATGETGKTFPAELSSVLNLSQPSLLLLTTAPFRQHKGTTRSSPKNAPPSPLTGPWAVVRDEQTGPWELFSDKYGWSINLSG